MSPVTADLIRKLTAGALSILVTVLLFRVMFRAAQGRASLADPELWIGLALLVLGPLMALYGILQLAGDLQKTTRNKIASRLKGRGAAREPADSAAYEGLRKQDIKVDGALGQIPVIGTQLAGTAKLRFCPRAYWNAAIPTSRPSSSNRPPPLEPRDIAALVWMTNERARGRRLEIKPSLKVSSSPLGVPIAYTRWPTLSWVAGTMRTARRFSSSTSS